MFLRQQLLNINTYLIALLSLVAVIGDYVVLHSKLHIFQAIFDNATHAIIGGISWFMVCLNYRNTSSIQTLVEIALCTAMASVIDLDHFIVAKSFQLKKATDLKQRPPLHCSSVPLVVCTSLLALSYIFQVNWLKKCSLILLTAFGSHHTRDATRRGYWLYPYGSTPPIPYGIYVALTCCIPYFVGFLYNTLKISKTYVTNNTTVI